jgi:thioredoxin reductase
MGTGAQVDGRAYDVVVIGGGAAGLSGALTLARARRSVLVVDAGEPRNAPATAVHSYLGREGTPPAELLAIGRAEAASYGAELVGGEVASVERRDDGFRVALADGTSVGARRLLVTAGLVDERPPLPGVAERWGRDVLHCPYCHGWEVRDQAIGVLGTGPMAVHQALLWRQWSADVTLLVHTGPRPTAEQAEQLAARGITVVEGEATHLVVEGDRLTGVALADRVVPVEALAVATQMRARAGFLASLGLATEPIEAMGHVIGDALRTDPMGATDVPGVWAAGNVVSPTDQVIAAAASANRAAGVINADLVTADTAAAVAAARTPAPA